MAIFLYASYFSGILGIVPVFAVLSIYSRHNVYILDISVINFNTVCVQDICPQTFTVKLLVQHVDMSMCKLVEIIIQISIPTTSQVLFYDWLKFNVEIRNVMTLFYHLVII